MWPIAILSSAGLTLGTNASLAISVILAIFIFFLLLHFQTGSKTHQPHTRKVVALSRETRQLEHEFHHSSSPSVEFKYVLRYTDLCAAQSLRHEII